MSFPLQAAAGAIGAVTAVDVIAEMTMPFETAMFAMAFMPHGLEAVACIETVAFATGFSNAGHGQNTGSDCDCGYDLHSHWVSPSERVGCVSNDGIYEPPRFQPFVCKAGIGFRLFQSCSRSYLGTT